MEKTNYEALAPAAHSDLWLARHGQTDWNLEGRWQGQSSDAPALNETGKTQALAILEQAKDLDISAVYTSDLQRAQQTAEAVARPLGLPVTVEPCLREMDLGAWEGMLYDDIRSQFPREYAQRTHDPIHTPAPDGESPLNVAERVIPAVEEIAARHPAESVLIVSHGISLAVLVCHAGGIPLDRVYEYVPENAKLYQVKWKISERSAN
jgi:broad specificity phosphatase PhoE